MTISNSKTWIKLNQIDCESRFNLNWLRKSFVANDFLIVLLHVCAVPKSRITHYPFLQPSQRYSRERSRAFIYLSSKQSLILTSAALIMIFNGRSFLFLEQN